MSETKKLEHSMSDAILTQYKKIAFEEGVRYALDYLIELYDGVRDTDLWNEYMNETPECSLYECYEFALPNSKNCKYHQPIRKAN